MASASGCFMGMMCSSGSSDPEIAAEIRSSSASWSPQDKDLALWDDHPRLSVAEVARLHEFMAHGPINAHKDLALRLSAAETALATAIASRKDFKQQVTNFVLAYAELDAATHQHPTIHERSHALGEAENYQRYAGAAIAAIASKQHSDRKTIRELLKRSKSIIAAEEKKLNDIRPALPGGSDTSIARRQEDIRTSKRNHNALVKYLFVHVDPKVNDLWIRE